MIIEDPGIKDGASFLQGVRILFAFFCLRHRFPPKLIKKGQVNLSVQKTITSIS